MGTKNLGSIPGSGFDFMTPEEHPRARELDLWYKQNAQALPALAMRPQGGGVSGPRSSVRACFTESNGIGASDGMSKDTHLGIVLAQQSTLLPESRASRRQRSRETSNGVARRAIT